MNKPLYYLIMGVLIVISILSLAFGAVNNRPTQFIAVLIADIVFSSLLVTIKRGLGIKDYIAQLLLAVGCVLLMTIFNIVIHPLIWGNLVLNAQSVQNDLVYGIRSTSLVLPILYLSYALGEKTKTEKIIIPEVKKSKKEKNN